METRTPQTEPVLGEERSAAPGHPMRILIRPFFACRLCWRITFAVFALILAVEAVILVPSARHFAANERQLLADQVQILIEPLLARHPPGAAPPDLRPALGQYGVAGISLHAPGVAWVASAGEAPELPGESIDMMARPFADGWSETTLVAAWLSPSMTGHLVAVRADASAIAPRLHAYVARVAGLVALIVLVVTVGTMFVIDLSVLRPVLRLRESSLRAGSEPESAERFTVPTRRQDEIGELVRAHNSMLQQISDSRRRDRELAEERAQFLAHHESLTGLPNRAALLEHLDREISARGATLLLVNLTQFRSLNAGFGTGIGDRILRDLALRLRSGAGASGFVAHLGADRFALALPGVLPAGDAALAAETVLRSLALPFEYEDGISLSPPARIGIAQSGSRGEDGPALLAQADLALSRTDGAGEVGYQFFSPSLALDARARQELARDLKHALERGELFIALQPKFRLAGEAFDLLAGAEVLVRWRHPSRGLVSPAEFIPLAEASGLIVPIGAFVLDAACGQIREWQARHVHAPRLAVNLSAQQFGQPHLLEAIERAMLRAGIPPDRLEFEITETAAMRDVERTSAILVAMRSLGVHVSIDDFGTGYSSLNYLRRFAVDAIKIDKSFVDDIGADHHAEAICDAILRLGQSLGTKVIAEGVENESQAQFLRQRRCDEAQGYLFGRPVPAAEFEKLHLRGKEIALAPVY